MAGSGKRIGISSTRSPRGLQAKGVTHEGKLPLAPGPLRVSTADRVPFTPFPSWSRQGLRPEEVRLPRLSKGRGSLGGCGRHRVTLIRNLLLLPALSSLRRRLQVEKSPVGAATDISTPEYLWEGNFSTRLPAPWRPGKLLVLRSWILWGTCCFGPFANLLEQSELSPTWAREAGWQCTSRHRLSVVDENTGNNSRRNTRPSVVFESPPLRQLLDVGLRGRVKSQNNGVRGQGRAGERSLSQRTEAGPFFLRGTYPSARSERRRLAGGGRLSGFPRVEDRTSLPIHYPQLHPLPAPNWLKQILKETRASLPHLEVAFPKSAP